MKRVVMVMMVLALLLMNYLTVAEAVTYVPDGRYYVTVDGYQLSVPMLHAEGHEPDVPHPEFTRAVLFPSNGTREILPLGQTLQEAAVLSGVLETTMFVGLQFLYLNDIQEHELEEEVCYWQHQWWFVGHLSQSLPPEPRPALVSSFTFMDSLVVDIVTNNPQLEAITWMGESAGGKLVHRWAAVTRLFEEMGDQLPPIINVTVNNGHWLYMDPYRYDLDDHFTIPGPVNQGFVPRWDKYPYGVDELNEYTTITGADYIVENYPNRHFFYFIGEGDTGLNSDDKPMNMEGMNNIIRHMVYWEHLHHFYGEAIDVNHTLMVMEDFDHEGHAIIRSQECRWAIFNYLPTGVNEGGGSSEIPVELELHSYPNPFNPSATVKVALPAPGHLAVKVYNRIGQFVATLADEEMVAGHHSFEFDGSDLASGVYFVQAVAHGQIYETKKLTLIK